MEDGWSDLSRFSGCNQRIEGIYGQEGGGDNFMAYL